MFLKQIITIGITTLIIVSVYSKPASAAWVQQIEKKWSWVEDGQEAKGWKQINNKWYHFNEDGVMNTGWFKENEKWYNLSDDGTMNVGWIEDNGKWYNFSSDGAMNTGWLQENDNWYFINSNGQMETGIVEIDGVIYTFLENGIMEKNNTAAAQSDQDTKTEQTSDTATTTGEERKGYVSTNSDPLNVRSSASAYSSVIGSLPVGSEITIIDKEKNGFYPINTNGTKGWVSAAWIKFGKVQASKVNSDDNTQLENDSFSTEQIRTKEPELDDKHYYSDENIFYKAKLSPPFVSGGRVIKGNCTWYAWGRAWEITGAKPIDAGFIGNACQWWEANKNSGKYQYGTEPRVGSIAVWNSGLPGSGGFGHVAIVEKINNGKIYISESMWHGDCFQYGEIYSTSYLYGYIYLDKPNY